MGTATFATTCRQCGEQLSAGTTTCPRCGTITEAAKLPRDPWSVWDRARNTMKTLWVVAVIAFWVSAIVLIIVSYIDNRLNLILASIALGLMILGVWLKTRYLMHLRKEPQRQAADVGAD